MKNWFIHFKIHHSLFVIRSSQEVAGYIKFNNLINPLNMRRVITILSACFLFLLAPKIQAQEIKAVHPDKPQYVEWNQLNPNQIILYNIKSGELIGTPLLHEDFMKGVIYFHADRKVSDLMINYNIFTGELLYKKEEHIYQVNTNDVMYFTVIEPESNKTQMYQQEFIPQASRSEFIQVLYEGNTSLFKRRVKEFRESDYKNPYSDAKRYDEYIDRTIYMVKHNREMKVLKPRKKAILELFSDQADQIRAYLKKEDINLHNENDLIKLIDHYNKLRGNY
jgi:flagellin-specific chaperone FliS